MLVEMLIQIQGSRDGRRWPPPGQCIDVPDHEAADLIAAGHATEADKNAEAWDEDAGTSGPAPAEDSGSEPAEESDADTAEDGDGDDGGDVRAATVPTRPRKATGKK